MENEKTILEDLAFKMEHNSSSLWLYLITRELKEGVKSSDKVLDKYDFKANKIDTSEEMQEILREVVLKQIQYAITKDNLEMKEFSIIDDDSSESIYTYALNNALSFTKIITEQLIRPTSIPPVSSLSTIKSKLWAFCIKITVNGKTFYSFRKASKTKIVTDEAQGLSNKIYAMFDSNDSELQLLHGETLAFDDKIDCIYIDEIFYVFKKYGFETLMGLDEEFKQNAETVIDTIIETELVDGLSELREAIETNKSLLKTLANISKRGNCENLNDSEITKMRDVLKKMENRDLKTNASGRIQIDTLDDFKDFAKLLNDYYKQGLVTGSYYGTNSGKIINVN